MNNLRLNNEPQQQHTSSYSPASSSYLGHLLKSRNEDLKLDNEETGKGYDGLKLGSKLLMRLVNQTYLSLPIKQCFSIEPSEAITADNYHHDQQARSGQHRDACFIDWNQSKILTNFESEEANEEREEGANSGFLLTNLFNNNDNDNLIDSKRFLNNHLKGNHSDLLSRMFNSTHLAGNNNRTTSNYEKLPLAIDFNLLKLSYLSISSLLAICGILINLFVISIIIFNTRQKRRSIIRTNNTGQNNLLLFQLTLTAILLSSYVLIDNLHIETRFHHQNIAINSSSQLDSITNLQDDSRRVQFCDFVPTNLHQPSSQSPLFTFLPPTPFHRNKLYCGNSIVNGQSDRSQGTPLENIHGCHKPVLILKFDSRSRDYDMEREENEIKGVIDSYENEQSSQVDGGLLYLEYHVPKNRRKLVQTVDVSDWIDFVFIAQSSNCSHQSRDYSTRINSIISNSVPNTDINPSSERSTTSKQWGLYYKYLDYLFISGILPLFMNVIASVHIWTVAALAYDRYCAIAQPLRYLRSIHTTRVRKFMIAVWTSALLLNLMWPIFVDQIALNNNLVNKDDPKSYQMLGLTKNDVDSSTWTRISNTEEINHNEHSDLDRCQFILDTGQQHSTLTSRCLSAKGQSIPRNRSELDSAKILATHLIELVSKSSSHFSRTNVISPTFNQAKYQKQANNNILIGDNEPSSISDNGENVDEVEDVGTGIRGGREQGIGNLYIALLLTYSLLGFLIIILVPLLIITICNILIYRIVKVHERRLSINSGSNIATSATQLNGPQQQQSYTSSGHLINHSRHHYLTKQRSEPDDIQNYEQTGSVTSLLISKLMGFGAGKPQQVATSTKQQNGDQTSCDSSQTCDSCTNKTTNYLINMSQSSIETPNQNIVNRPTSKRTLARQDSYQLISKLLARDSIDIQNNIPVAASPKLPRDSFNGNQPQKERPVKRKISDHGIGNGYSEAMSDVSRKNSSVSQVDSEYGCQVSMDESTITNNIMNCDHLWAINAKNHDTDGGGIMNQLKMAGLSFAGVAINEPIFMGQRFSKNLSKSSSRSMGNLNYCNVQSRTNGNYMSRSSIETTSSSVTTSPRKCNISVCQQSSSTYNKRPLTKLVDDENVDTLQNHQYYQHQQMTQSGSNINLNHCHHHNYHRQTHQNHPRLPFTLGTKSPAFNVIIWLIFTMLIFTIPHYILVTVNQVEQLNSRTRDSDIALKMLMRPVDLGLSYYAQRLESITKMILNIINLNKDSTDTDLESTADINSKPTQTSVQLSSTWLSCLCRLLFMAMVPLNGWLYGIRSRSLRATLRMVLKRYISRRQASIEINQRQRSISSVRSRDSSFANLTTPYYQQSVCSSCQYKVLTGSPERTSFRRCSSLTGVKRGYSDATLVSNAHMHHRNSVTLPSNVSENQQNILIQPDAKQPKVSTEQAGGTIRFLIGDYSNDKEATDQTETMTSLTCFGRNPSPSQSLADDSKSLVSASIASTQSLSLSIFGDGYLENRNQPAVQTATSNTGHNQLPDRDNQLSSSNSTLELCSLMGDTKEELKGMPDKTRISNRQRRNAIIINQLNQNGTYQQQPQQSGSTLSTTEAQSTKCLIRKSCSEFKFFITTAPDTTDQTQHDSGRLLNHQKQPHEKRNTLLSKQPNVKSKLQTSLVIDDELILNNQLQPQRCWWRELKNNLTRLLIDVPVFNWNQARSIDRGASAIKKPELDEFEDQDQSCKSLLRRNSADDSSQNVKRSHWKYNSLNSGRLKNFGNTYDNNFLANNIFGSERKRKVQKNKLRFKNKLRNSHSLNSIDGYHHYHCQHEPKIQFSPKFNHSYQVKHMNLFRERNLDKGSSLTLDQSPTYLKPPNFLKLIFDPNNLTSPYSGSSALSPIKECSSNHSYASSQSSLNNGPMSNLLVGKQNQIQSEAPIDNQLPGRID